MRVVNRDGAHFDDDLLDDVVAVVVIAALQELAGRKESAQQAQFLVDAEDLQGRLYDSAAVLVARITEDVRLQVLVDLVEVFARHGALTRLRLLNDVNLGRQTKRVDDLRVHLQDYLKNIVAKVVHEEVCEFDVTLRAQSSVQEPFFFKPVRVRVTQAPLDEARQALVTAALEDSVLNLVKGQLDWH